MTTLNGLNRRLLACRACPRLVEYRERIGRDKKRAYEDWSYWSRPVPGFGDPSARLVLVGLAPGAHGSNRTGRMFTGDASGDWLYDTLHRYGFANQALSASRDDGLHLHDCYITAAVRCAPPGNKPVKAEFDACRPYLVKELQFLHNTRVVLGLGRIGFDAWLKAAGWWTAMPPADRPRFAHGAETTLADGTCLIASYHPSRQNTNTGTLTRRMWHAVFRRARRRLDLTDSTP